MLPARLQRACLAGSLFLRRKTCVPNGDEDGLGFALGPGVLSINIQRCHFHAVMSSARATQEPLDTSARPVHIRKLCKTAIDSTTTGPGLESSLPHHWTLKSRRYRVCDLTSRPTNRHVHLHACITTTQRQTGLSIPILILPAAHNTRRTRPRSDNSIEVQLYQKSS
jgi:hypothetical protein